jgi:hypothetical protein
MAMRHRAGTLLRSLPFTFMKRRENGCRRSSEQRGRVTSRTRHAAPSSAPTFSNTLRQKCEKHKMQKRS